MAEWPASWLQPNWPAPARVRAVVTTRAGAPGSATSGYGFNVGTRCGDDVAVVAANRASLRAVLALPAAPHWLQQVHGSACVALDGTPSMGEPLADAALTRAAGVVLAIQTADCLPVLLCAEDGQEIAAAHAGWRGLAAGVLESTLMRMRSPRQRVLAWLGPAIAARSYEVGAEVRMAFVAQADVARSAFTASRDGHWQCDLYALARQRLHAAGVTRVYGGDRNTFDDPALHSYRRDGARSGRMASLIWLLT